MRQRIQPRSTNHPFGLIPIFELENPSDREWFGDCQVLELEVLRVDVRERAYEKDRSDRSNQSDQTDL